MVLSAKPSVQLRDVPRGQNPRRLPLPTINDHCWIRLALAPFQVRQRVNDVAVGGEHKTWENARSPAVLDGRADEAS
jgi:hypothetical protein